MKAPTALVSPVVIFYGGVVLEGFLQEFKLLNWLWNWNKSLLQSQMCQAGEKARSVQGEQDQSRFNQSGLMTEEVLRPHKKSQPC